MFLLSSDSWKVKLTKHKGKGIFAKKDIPAGTVIGDYLGTLIPSKKEDEYEKKYGLYSLYYHDHAAIFPDLTKDGIHLLNHSCEPNCYMYSYQGHTLFFTLRHIFKGEELTISYLINPLDEECKPCTHLCKCGAELCSDTWHLSQNQFDAWTAYDEKRTKKVKLPRTRYGKTLPKLAKYPKTVRDHTVYPLFGSPNKPALALSDGKLPSRKALRQTIRKTGKTLYFKRLGIRVRGISNDHLICRV